MFLITLMIQHLAQDMVFSFSINPWTQSTVILLGKGSAVRVRMFIVVDKYLASDHSILTDYHFETCRNFPSRPTPLECQCSQI